MSAYTSRLAHTDITPPGLPDWMRITHIYGQGEGRSHLYATVICQGRTWQIRDGWNCGQQSQDCVFPSFLCVTRYLAGTWGIPVSDVAS